MSQEEIHDLLAYDGVKIIQRKDLFRFSLDSLLLGDFVKINPRANMIVDFGTGLGPIPLYLSMKTKKPIIGIDIQEEALILAKKSVELNHLDDQISFKHVDINNILDVFDPSSIDIITINPPFFKYHNDEFVNKLDSFTISRHEVLIDLEGIIKSARKIISNGGTINMVHRANRLEEIFLLLNQYNFKVKRIRFVYTKSDKEAMMILIEARFNGKPGDLKVEQPLVIYDENNDYTKEVLNIFHLGDETYETKFQLSK